jgi:DAK2 domain fusion protein YloV
MKTINGHILKQMILSGSNNLYNHYPEVDALNVFPVPDGDTGTNMNLTISSGAKEVANLNNARIFDVARAFSRGLLMGARGNSGVILSQIFRGFSMAMEGKDEINVEEFARAWDSGREIAYKAVMRPVEGTVLTVIRESSTALMEHVHEMRSIEQAMDYLISEARASLNRTPELLPVLKDVGVVDSGGAGLLYILEGFQLGLTNRFVERKEISQIHTDTSTMAGADIDQDDEESYGYCTEFLIRLEPDNPNKKTFNQKNFSNMIQKYGVSCVVVRDEDIVKVHVHTLKPGSVLNYAQGFGEFIKLKIENMQEQHSQLVAEAKAPEAPRSEYAIIAVSVGEGLSQMFKDLRVTHIVSGGQTMNPSTEDFIKVIKSLRAKNVIILPNNSNIIMAANQACQVVEDCNCVVVPTKTISQGLTACMMFNPEADVETNIAEMTDAISRVKSGQVTYSIKSTVIDGVDIKEKDFMGISEKKIVCAMQDRLEVCKNLIDKMVDEDSAIATIIYGEDGSEEEANELAAYIEDKYGIDVEVHNGGQPVYYYFLSVE